MSEYTNRTLCSIWDFVHFTAFQSMTIPEIMERFGVTQDTAERWLGIAIELGVEVSEVETPEGVAYRTTHRQGYEAVDKAIAKLHREQRQRRNDYQRKFRDRQKV